jgi:hypothetical protein
MHVDNNNLGPSLIVGLGAKKRLFWKPFSTENNQFTKTGRG